MGVKSRIARSKTNFLKNLFRYLARCKTVKFEHLKFWIKIDSKYRNGLCQNFKFRFLLFWTNYFQNLDSKKIQNRHINDQNLEKYKSGASKLEIRWRFGILRSENWLNMKNWKSFPQFLSHFELGPKNLQSPASKTPKSCFSF